MKNTISRRRLLKGALVFGATSLAAACGGNAGNTPSATTSAGDTTGTETGLATDAAVSTTVPEATVGADATVATTAEATAADTSATVAPTAGTDATAQPQAGAVTLRVWGYGLDDARAQARVAEFKKNNPNVDVQPVGGTLNTQQLLTAIASGDPPEVINIDRSQTGSWAARSAIDPIDDLISGDQFDTSQFYPFTIEQTKYNGKQYGIPQFVNVDMIFMNLNALKEAGVDPASVDPGNWENLQMLGEKMHKIDGNVLSRTGFDTKVQDGRLWLWSWANGVDLMSADGTKLNFTDPKVIETLQWAKDTVDKQGGEKARAAFQQSQNFFSAQNPVLIGQIAMTVFEQWLIGVMKVDPNAAFMSMLPRMRNSQMPLTDATGSAFAIPRGIVDTKRAAAWSFIKGMTSTEAWLAGEQATFNDNQAQNTPYHPTITGNQAADNEAWTKLYKGISEGYDATVKLFPDALANAKYRYSGPVAAQVADAMTSNVNDALQGVKSPEQAMTDLQQAVQQAQTEFGTGG